MDLKQSYDAIVIGAGAGGGAAAWRLAHHGKTVLLLDAGPRFNPTADYKLMQPDWERHNFPNKTGSRGQVSFGDLGRVSEQNKHLFSWNTVKGRLSAGNTRRPLGSGYEHVQGIGGSTLHFVGEAHRLNARSFSMASDFGVGADWPLTYDDLEPYYVIAEKVLGVAGSENQKECWRSSAFPLPAHLFSPAATRLVEAGAKLGMHWQANSRAALSIPYENRPQCNYCGNCSRGCPLGDKGSSDVTFIRQAEQSNCVTIKPLSSVIRMEADDTGHIKTIRFANNGKYEVIEAGLVVLAAGAVQTPRLLLHSQLANSSGQVGKNFMELIAWSAAGFAEDIANTHMGLPADAICWDFNAPDAIRDVIGGCRFTSSVQDLGLTGPIAYMQHLISGHSHEAKAQLHKYFGKAVAVSAIGESLPNSETFIDLHPSETDQNGIPIPRIHAKLGENEIKRLNFMASTCRRLIAKAGVKQLRLEQGTYDFFSSTHVFGTCRMGSDPLNSVVDQSGRSHDHPNMLITDASIFPSSGGGEAPSLTIQALAIRSVDQYYYNHE